MKQAQIEFTDDEVIATMVALNDFILTATLLFQDPSYGNIPDQDRYKYLELMDHAVQMHEKFNILYQETKRSFQ